VFNIYDEGAITMKAQGVSSVPALWRALLVVPAALAVLVWLLLAGVPALVAPAAQAATIRVERDGSADFKTIQTALNHSTPGDTILIGPGRYTEYQTMRLPGWSWDVDVYAYVPVPEITLIGAGREETVIGPLVADFGHTSPQAHLRQFGA
jgi:pectin methylesterase-like acyl-CoA thioesterase